MLKEEKQLLLQLRQHNISAYEHSMRVGFTLKKIAQYYILHDLGNEFTMEDLEYFECAGRLHDIGKLKIPNAILNKSTALTQEELKEIHKHVEYGMQLIDAISFPNERAKTLITNCILFHHERMDGKGYPRNVPEEMIPKEGQLAAIADVFCAATESRTYDGALTPTEAIEQIESGKGGQINFELFNKFKPMLAPNVAQLNNIVNNEG